jgi:hypothetical protein
VTNERLLRERLGLTASGWSAAFASLPKLRYRGYELDHLLTEKVEIYREQVSAVDDYPLLRSRIGGLVLVHGLENASFGSMALAAKTPLYRAHNHLAGSYQPRRQPPRACTTCALATYELAAGDRYADALRPGR